MFALFRRDYSLHRLLHDEMVDQRRHLHHRHFLDEVEVAGAAIVPSIAAIVVDHEAPGMKRIVRFPAPYSYQHRRFVPAHAPIFILLTHGNTQRKHVLDRTVHDRLIADQRQARQHFHTDLESAEDNGAGPLGYNYGF